MGADVPPYVLRLPFESVPDEFDIHGVGEGAARRLFVSGEAQNSARRKNGSDFNDVRNCVLISVAGLPRQPQHVLLLCLGIVPVIRVAQRSSHALGFRRQ